MRITVKQTNSVHSVIADIIEKAKQEADKGNKYFSYDFGSKEVRTNLESQLRVGSIKAEVAGRTENTVTCCYRGDYWSSIEFCIASE